MLLVLITNANQKFISSCRLGFTMTRWEYIYFYMWLSCLSYLLNFLMSSIVCWLDSISLSDTLMQMHRNMLSCISLCYFYVVLEVWYCCLGEEMVTGKTKCRGKEETLCKISELLFINLILSWVLLYFISYFIIKGEMHELNNL